MQKTMRIVITRIFSIALILLTVAAAFPSVGDSADASYAEDNRTVKVGLYYGSNGLGYANLQNETGSGYDFGYFDDTRNFVALGGTELQKITMLKDWNMYITSDANNKYADENPGSAKTLGVVGCYHIRLSSYGSYEEAKAAASGFAGGFPSYVNGSFYANVGNYTSHSDADSAMVRLGISGEVFTGSDKCVTVVETGTADILFEYDVRGGGLGVMPRSVQFEKPVTWFKGYKYFGGFEYFRNSGANMTVINYVNMEDYISGVLPFEMSPSWPIEALKAQAICARTYAAYNHGKHGSYGFDVCATADCQVYQGQNNAAASIDQAVYETSGMYITFNGAVASIFYHSSDGGATEDCENVFYEAIPYLRGVSDPYEKYVKTGKESWTNEYTSAQITTILQNKGYSISDVVSVTPTYTKMGNIYSLKFTDIRGKNFTFERETARTILSSSSLGKTVHSLRFSVVGSNNVTAAGPEPAYVEGELAPLPDGDYYAIGSGGQIELIPGSTVTAITASGNTNYKIGEQGQELISGVPQTGGRFTVRGSGWGHNVGMSQWGARAMAEQGLTYRDILNFYFTGVTISQ